MCAVLNFLISEKGITYYFRMQFQKGDSKEKKTYYDWD